MVIYRCHDCIDRNAYGILQKFLELMSEFSKITGYTVNIQKAFVLLYTSNKQVVSEI